MLAYRHAFHAGNHGDVLKHLLLVACLRHLTAKEKPFWVVDTHAGAGGYALDHGFARHRAEFRQGIGRLWKRTDTPPLVSDYLEQVRAFDARHGDPSADRGEAPVQYPGSPELVRGLLRPGDRARLFELHPADHAVLEAHFADDRRFVVERADGFGAVKALLPPPPRRALVLLDPPYEIKDDYTLVLEAVRTGLRRFAQGTFMVWLPALSRPEPGRLADRLAALGLPDWLMAGLWVAEPGADGFGMLGSQVFVANPPWTLRERLQSELPWLATCLGGPAARFRLDGQSS